MVGFSFANTDEAADFYSAYSRRESFVVKPAVSLSTGNFPRSSSIGSLNSKEKDSKGLGGFFGSMGRSKTSKGKSKIDKSMISAPSDFKHVSHVGYDPKKGFSAANIPMEWKLIFQKAGITDEQLADRKTAKIITKFMKEHSAAATGQPNQPGHIKQPSNPARRAPPPPPPSRGAGRAPPPPPPSRNNPPPMPPSSSRSVPSIPDRVIPESIVPQAAERPAPSIPNREPPIIPNRHVEAPSRPSGHVVSGIPPPPPPAPPIGGPPPPPAPPTEGPPPPPAFPSRTEKVQMPAPTDARSNLLAAIQQGTTLRKANEVAPAQKEEPPRGTEDIADLLRNALNKRSNAVGGSDSEEDDDDDDEW